MVQSAFLGTCLAVALQVPICYLSYSGTAHAKWWTIQLPTEILDTIIDLAVDVDYKLGGQLGGKGKGPPTKKPPTTIGPPPPQPPARPTSSTDRPPPKISGPKQKGAMEIMQPGDRGYDQDGHLIQVGPTGEIPLRPPDKWPSGQYRGLKADQINQMFQFRLAAAHQVTLIETIIC